jgi:2-iminobutanoate/2-iminopropanoate deaminase
MTYDKRQIVVDDLPVPTLPLSQAVEAGPFVFVSGQSPRDPKTMTIPDGIEAQTHVVLDNLDTALRAAGCSLRNVVKVTAHLADLSDRAAFNVAYRAHVPEPFPARTTVGSQLGGILVEIDAIAVKPGPGGA